MRAPAMSAVPRRRSEPSPAAAADHARRTRTASSAATRRTILEAAAAILSTRDEEDLSIREVCSRAGVTAPTIYHHFGDRRALIDRVVEDCFATFDRWLADRAPPRDPVDALHWGFDRYVDFGVAHPTEYRLLFGRQKVRPTEQGLVAYERLRHGMREVEAAGRLRVPVDAATLAYWSVAHGVTSLAVLGILAPGGPIAAIAREGVIARITLPARVRRRRRG
jgi:AcrR family transcriptional regulator